MVTLAAPHHAKSMPSKLDEKSETDRVHLVAPRALLARVKRWRRHQEEMPNLSAAIRTLLEIALDREENRLGIVDESASALRED